MPARNYLYMLYQITNNLNGKIYVGVHVTENINDNYMGSGTAILQALKKHGSDNFTREILEIFDNYGDMLEAERKHVDMTFVSRRDTYNMVTGGVAGRKLSEDTKQKMSDSSKGFVQSVDHKRKIGEGNSKRIVVHGVEFPSIKQCAQWLFMNERTVTARCASPIENGFNYVDRPVVKRKRLYNKTSSKPVCINGVEYHSAVEASKVLGVSTALIHRRNRHTFTHKKTAPKGGSIILNIS